MYRCKYTVHNSKYRVQHLQYTLYSIHVLFRSLQASKGGVGGVANLVLIEL
jgi:hypothetical protein